MIRRSRQAGVTLIELVTSMVILAVALGGILLTLNGAIRRSADPLVQEQASALAQAYLEEVTSKPFCDPDFSTSCPTACTTSPCGACAGAIGPPESRATYDDVCDYAGLTNVGARDQFNNPIAALNNYTVGVVVSGSGETLNGLSSNSGQIVRVSVTVAHPALSAPVVVAAYRANY
ncbi:MAG: prepilin-type N-terminal cleavage/methylation domain-containing protein [Gammaproteobacteria bacterium]|nr:prepilin-type N-terminal cleavage/methylation domain-containing protein [Gammaproteobacteria bacterium]